MRPARALVMGAFGRFSRPFRVRGKEGGQKRRWAASSSASLSGVRPTIVVGIASSAGVAVSRVRPAAGRGDGPRSPGTWVLHPTHPWPGVGVRPLGGTQCQLLSLYWRATSLRHTLVTAQNLLCCQCGREAERAGYGGCGVQYARLRVPCAVMHHRNGCGSTAGKSPHQLHRLLQGSGPARSWLRLFRRGEACCNLQPHSRHAHRATGHHQDRPCVPAGHEFHEPEDARRDSKKCESNDRQCLPYRSNAHDQLSPPFAHARGRTRSVQTRYREPPMRAENPLAGILGMQSTRAAERGVDSRLNREVNR